MMRLLIASLIAASVSVFAQPVPLPNLPDGFRVGTSGPVVEAFLDMLCPDCRADWPTMTSLRAFYGNKISFILHTFPLPYHTFAFRAAQGVHVIASLNTTSPAQAAFDYATMLFTNQNDFFGAGLNQSWVDQHIVDLVTANLGYAAADVAAGLASSDLNEDTRISWKYSTSRYSTGTPHYMINGIPVDDQLGDGSLSAWQALIDPLLAGMRAPKAPAITRFTSKDL